MENSEVFFIRKVDYMKISIITVLNTVNYGSVLQTLATQNFWEKLGVEVEFVDFMRNDQTLRGRIVQKLTSKPKGYKQMMKWPFRTFIDIISTTLSYRVFRAYIKKNISLSSKTYTSYDDIVADTPRADIYCTGSDQMWNSVWNQGIEHSFFLEYAPKGKRKIAFSTSIGKTSFDENEAETIVPLIKQFDFITLREQSAVELLKSYGVTAECILDPTLLMNKEQWEPYVGKKLIQDQYLLVYQLHNQHDNADFAKAVEKIAQKKHLQIIRIAYSYSDTKSGKKVVMPKIEEFLSLIYYADYIVTDSFHGTAFSINFNKQFSVIYPRQFSTRMDNILKLTELQKCRYVDATSVNEIPTIDYQAVNDKLECLRKDTQAKFLQFIK